MADLAGAIAALLASGQPGALVGISRAKGSTPRDSDARMLVALDFVRGTIGGGQAEAMAIVAAREMLDEGRYASTLDIPLGPQIGQCCGGHLALNMTRLTPTILTQIKALEQSEANLRPLVMIYGAGHVGRALAQALCLLPMHVRLVDSRATEFAGLNAPGVEIVCTSGEVAQAENAPPGAAHVILTHSHALDSLIAASLLERGDFKYLGIIGSQTKRQTFVRAFREMGIAEAQLARITCPIGGAKLRDKRPEVIAALTAAELLGVFGDV